MRRLAVLVAMVAVLLLSAQRAEAYYYEKINNFENAGMWVPVGADTYVSFNVWTTRTSGTGIFASEQLNWYAESYSCPPAGGLCTSLWSDNGWAPLSIVTKSGQHGFAVAVTGTRGVYIFEHTPTTGRAPDRELNHHEQTWGFVSHDELRGWHNEGTGSLNAPGEGSLTGYGWQSFGRTHYFERD